MNCFPIIQSNSTKRPCPPHWGWLTSCASLLEANLLHQSADSNEMAVLLSERFLKLRRHLIMAHGPREFDEQLPAVVVREFSDVDRMETLCNGHSRIRNNLHESDGGHGIRIGHGRDARWVCAQLPQGIPDDPNMGR